MHCRVVLLVNLFVSHVMVSNTTGSQTTHLKHFAPCESTASSGADKEVKMTSRYSNSDTSTWYATSLRRARKWLTAALLLSTAWAAVPVEIEASNVDYSQGRYQERAIDMSIATIGGMLEMKRSWNGEKWTINPAFRGMKIVRTMATMDVRDDNVDYDGYRPPVELYYNGAKFTRSGSNESFPFRFLAQRRAGAFSGVIEQISKTEFKWTDAYGNWKLFKDSNEQYVEESAFALGAIRFSGGDSYGSSSQKVAIDLAAIKKNTLGALIAQGDIYSEKYRFEYNGDYSRMLRIKNAADLTLVTFTHADYSTWLDDKPPQVRTMTDYTGRVVTYSYNDDGELVRLTDVNGNEWRFNAGMHNRTDAEGNRVTFSFGAKQPNVDAAEEDTVLRFSSSSSSESGGSVSFRKAAARREFIKSINYEDGRRFDYNYNYDKSTQRYIQTVSDAHGRVTETTYGNGDGDSLIQEIIVNGELEQRSTRLGSTRTQIEDAFGQKTITTKDGQARLTQIQYPDLTTETWAYDNLGRTTQYKDRDGVITATEYSGNVVRITQAKGTTEERVLEQILDGHGQIVEARYYEGASVESTFRYEYNNYGRVTKVIYPDLTEETFTYAVEGSINTYTNAVGQTWTYVRDNVGGVLSYETPLGFTTQYQYNKIGQLTKVILPDLAEYNYTYTQGRMTKITGPDGFSVAQQFDKGRLVAVTDALGNVSNHKWDTNGRLVKLIDPAANEISFTYNHNQITQVVLPNNTESYIYDANGRVKKATLEYDDKSISNNYRYTPHGQMKEFTDALENSSSQEFDALGRVTKSFNVDQTVTEYEWSAWGNLLSVTDASLKTTRFEYNNMDQLVAEILPMGQRYFYSYRDDGLLESTTYPDGKIAKYGYDIDGRTRSIRYYRNAEAVTNNNPGLTVTADYNSNGLLTAFNDGTVSESYAYTSRGKLQRVTTDFGPFSKTISYTYYANDWRKSFTNAEGITYSYSYNKNGTLQGIGIPAVGRIEYKDFDYLAPRQQTLPGGAQINRTYSGIGELLTQTYVDPANNVLNSFTLQYNSIGQLEEQQLDSQKTVFDYNEAYRLANVITDDVVVESYEYDDVGNRTLSSDSDEAWQYTDNHQLAENPKNEYQYDANGQLISQTAKTADGKTLTYTYDIRDRLSEVRDASDNLVASYYVSAQDLRIRKTTSAGTTYYLYSADGLSAEYDASGNLQKEYGYIPDARWMTDPQFQRSGGKLYYYLNDQRGAPLAMVSSSGAMVWRASHDAFGEATVEINTVSNNLRLPGQYFDAETERHYNGYRDYDPDLGRYIQRDPLGLAAGVNTYGYAYQDPINFVDVDGRFANVVASAAARLYARCVMSCLAQSGLAIGAAELIAIYIFDCEPSIERFGNELASAAKACGLACLNPLEWIGNGKKSPGKKPHKKPNNKNEPEVCPIGGANSFIAGTEVLTEHGLVPIETLQEGDWVYAKNDLTGEVALRQIVQMFHSWHDGDVIELTVKNPDGVETQFTTTEEHPFWVNNHGWKNAGGLGIQDVLVTLNGDAIEILGIKAVDGRTETFNFEVDDFHTYAIGWDGVWVHNTSYHGNNPRSPEPTQHYTVWYEDGTRYDGVGDIGPDGGPGARAKQSARERNPGVNSQTTVKNYDNRADALISEQKGIDESLYGKNDKGNHNKSNSPGNKLIDKDGNYNSEKLTCWL